MQIKYTAIQNEAEHLALDAVVQMENLSAATNHYENVAKMELEEGGHHQWCQHCPRES